MLEKMSDVSGLAKKISNLVCDAVPDPPRSLNNTSDKPNLSQDHQQTNKKKSNIPFINRSESSTSNSTSNTTKTDDLKYTKPKKRSKSNNVSYNIINSTNVKIGPRITNEYHLNNFQNPDFASSNRCDKEETKQMLPHIKALSISEVEITKEDILLIKDHLGNGWKEVAKGIGYLQGQIEQFLENHKHKGIDEVIYCILIDWKQSHTKDATVGHLVCAMWSSKEYECVEKLAATHSTAI